MLQPVWATLVPIWVFSLLFPLHLYRPITSAVSSVNWLLFLLIRKLITLQPNSSMLFLALRSLLVILCTEWFSGCRWQQHGQLGWACSFLHEVRVDLGLLCLWDSAWGGWWWVVKHVREIDFHHHWRHVGNIPGSNVGQITWVHILNEQFFCVDLYC